MNNYLEKGFFINEKESKQLTILPDDVKLRIRAVDQLETYFFMENNTEIFSVVNTIKIFHIQYYFHLIYKQNFYNEKQKEIDEIINKYHIPLITNIDHPALIEE